MMRLSLSGRLVEVEYRTCELRVPEFLRLAHRCGYDAVELRATQITVDTTPAEVREFRRVADDLGLSVSCCTPPGVAADRMGLTRVDQFLPIARMLGCDTLKVWAKDIDWIQQACDRVKPDGLTLIAQVHTGGPFETIDSCLETLAQVGRENFGLQYDPANLFEAHQDYGEEAVKRLGSYIRQLSVQSERLASPDEADVWVHEGRHYRRCFLDDPDGLDYASVFRGLRAIGFDGYVILNSQSQS